MFYHHANTDKPERFFVRLYKLYNSRCPANRPDHAYYLRSLEEQEGDCWYSTQPVGRNKLNISISKMCKNAGIPGFHTNYSLRATAATRLHQSGRERDHGKDWAQSVVAVYEIIKGLQGSSLSR